MQNPVYQGFRDGEPRLQGFVLKIYEKNKTRFVNKKKQKTAQNLCYLDNDETTLL